MQRTMEESNIPTIGMGKSVHIPSDDDVLAGLLQHLVVGHIVRRNLVNSSFFVERRFFSFTSPFFMADVLILAVLVLATILSIVSLGILLMKIK